MAKRVWIAANEGFRRWFINYLSGFHKSWKEEHFHGWMQKFPTMGLVRLMNQVDHKSKAKYSFGNNISKLEVTMLAKWMTTPLIIDIEYNYYSVHPFFLFINVTLVKNCVVNALIMYVTYNISYLMLSKEKQWS